MGSNQLQVVPLNLSDSDLADDENMSDDRQMEAVVSDIIKISDTKISLEEVVKSENEKHLSEIERECLHVN